MFRRSLCAAPAALILVAAGAAAGTAPATATGRSAAPPPAPVSWDSAASGLGGVSAHGHYRRTADRVRLAGSLSDTADDGRTVRLDVRPTGGCCFRIIRNARGAGTRVAVDATITGTRHLAVREVTSDGRRLRVGRWVPLY